MCMNKKNCKNLKVEDILIKILVKSNRWIEW